jgi:hypothetical protein
MPPSRAGWRTSSHPDPTGVTLVHFASAVRHAQKQAAERHNAPLPKELAIFFDWCSLTQKDADGRRSADEQAAFSSALASMQLWYAHQLTTVFLMREGCDDPSGTSYEARGVRAHTRPSGWSPIRTPIACRPSGWSPIRIQ